MVQGIDLDASAASEITPLLQNIDNNAEKNDNVNPQGTTSRHNSWKWIAIGTLAAFGFCGGYVGGRILLQSSSQQSTTFRGHRSSHVSEDDDYVRFDDSFFNEQEATKVKYIATQFVSFTINTLGGLESMGECHGHVVSTSGECYLGNVHNITEDVQHRLNIVKLILAKLRADQFHREHDIDHSDDVLKIVMLPEFFWRGPQGAYSTKEFLSDNGVLVQVSNQIRKLIDGEFFNDFLFVFGTVIAAQSVLDPSMESTWESNQGNNSVPSSGPIEFFNFASVAKGGPGGKYFAVTKKYISDADFLSHATLPNPKDNDIHDYTAMGDAFETAFSQRNITIVRDNVVELDGLRIGIEICLDHRLGVLWNHLKTKHQAELVDVLLITSAGMAIEDGPNPIVTGGVVYLSDGGASSAACMRTDDSLVFNPNMVCRGEIGGLKHIPIGGPGYVLHFTFNRVLLLAASIDPLNYL